jgi:flagellar basal body-associated protein FliL
MSDAAATPALVAEGAPAAPPAPGRRRFVIRAAIGVVGLGGLGAGAWLLPPRLRRRSPAPTGDAPAPVTIKATVPLGAVVVNLAGETRRYARVGVSLGVPTAKDVKEIEDAKTQLLDVVIAVLSSRAADALVAEQGREAIKEELLQRIHRDLGLAKAKRVYFTEFVVQ